MKKLLIAVLIAGSSCAFAYNATIVNNSSKIVTLKAAGNPVCTILASSQSPCELNPYTSYQAVYAGQWSDQGLFTIQKYSDLVLQLTPIAYNQALTGYKIDIQADGTSGYAYNFLNNSAKPVMGGSCFADMGGVTCKLANGDQLNNLTLTLNEERPQ